MNTFLVRWIAVPACLLAAPLASQVPLPQPRPPVIPPSPAPCLAMACAEPLTANPVARRPTKPVETVKFLPAWRASEDGVELKGKPRERALKAVPYASPMPFLAVGDGAGDSSSSIYRFSYSGGTINSFVNLGEAGVVLWDIAINPSGAPWDPAYAISQQGKLYRIDQTTGAKTLIGSTGRTINSLEFCNGTLYGWGTRDFVSIDPVTAQTTLISQTSVSAAGDLMCNAPYLYGISGTGAANNDLFIFNTTYGLTSWTGVTFPYKNFYGGEFDPYGAMWLARQTTTGSAGVQFYHFDINSHVLTLVGTLSTSVGMNGLATYPAYW